MKNILLFILIISWQLNAQPFDPEKNESSEDLYIFKLNRITLPVHERGMIGFYFDEGGRTRLRGYTDSGYFLNSLGFFISGINEKNETWANGVQSGLGINDYLKGPIDQEADRSLFKNSIGSVPFGEEWENWKSAVEQGAEFYDGDNNGIYEPEDKNFNGIWDENEDRPALYGDITIWSVYNDGALPEFRKTENVEPQGIEVRQTVWAYSSVPELESVFFIKYSLLNTGKVTNVHDSVYFSFSADGIIGWRNDELFGSMPHENTSYIYTSTGNPYFEKQTALLVSQLQGPIVESNSSEDLAFQISGENFRYEEFEGKRNLNLSSVGNVNEGSNFTDTESIRKLTRNSGNRNPCEDTRGIVSQMNCSSVDKKFLYSGDPFLRKGWINTYGSDKWVFMSSGPFKLEKNKPVEIIYAVVLGEAVSGYEALNDAVKKKQFIDYFYYYPPEPPPEVKPTIVSNQNNIELIWETKEFFDYGSKGFGYDMKFEGFNVYMYQTNSTAEEVDGRKNKIKIMSYDVKNNINRILIEDNEELDTDVIYSGGEQLDEFIYADPQSGRIILTINRDPFSLSTLKLGKPYFISITPFSLNYEDLIPYDYQGSVLIPRTSEFGYFEPEEKIINDKNGNEGIVVGEAENSSFFKGVEIDHTEGNSEVNIYYSIYDQNRISQDLYEIGFSRNLNDLYSVNMYLKNLTQDYFLIENYPADRFSSDIVNLTDGFLLNFEWIGPGIKEYTFEGGERWFTEFNNIETGVFYIGRDTYNQDVIAPISPRKFSSAVSADKLTDINLRFGETSKAYRYLREAVRYLYTGFPDQANGYVDIPVSAYGINLDGTETKLSLGFLENAYFRDSLNYPDLKWNPGTDLQQSKEYLIVFNSEYDEDPNRHKVYTGTSESPANISLGYSLQSSNDSLNFVARSPWFDAIYIIGFETDYYDPEFSPTGILNVKANKVLSEKDKYTFRVKDQKTFEEKKAQFEKIKIFPNPLFAGNDLTKSYGIREDEPFITFSHLPQEVNIKIFTIGGIFVKSIHKNNPSTTYRWNLENESGIKVASGMFIAVVESPELGKKILKFAVIIPQKQIHY